MPQVEFNLCEHTNFVSEICQGNYDNFRDHIKKNGITRVNYHVSLSRPDPNVFKTFTLHNIKDRENFLINLAKSLEGTTVTALSCVELFSFLPWGFRGIVPRRPPEEKISEKKREFFQALSNTNVTLFDCPQFEDEAECSVFINDISGTKITELEIFDTSLNAEVLVACLRNTSISKIKIEEAPELTNIVNKALNNQPISLSSFIHAILFNGEVKKNCKDLSCDEGESSLRRMAANAVTLPWDILKSQPIFGFFNKKAVVDKAYDMAVKIHQDREKKATSQTQDAYLDSGENPDLSPGV